MVECALRANQDHFRRKYHNYAFCIQHSALWGTEEETVVSFITKKEVFDLGAGVTKREKCTCSLEENPFIIIMYGSELPGTKECKENFNG